MVLADNVDGGDDLDLIVTTMNGNVFCFSTPSPHHPLKVWHLQMLAFAFFGLFINLSVIAMFICYCLFRYTKFSVIKFWNVMSVC